MRPRLGLRWKGCVILSGNGVEDSREKRAGYGRVESREKQERQQGSGESHRRGVGGMRTEGERSKTSDPRGGS